MYDALTSDSTMFTSSRAPSFRIPANDPESRLELATRAATVEQPIPGHEASSRCNPVFSPYMYRASHAEDKTSDKRKPRAFPPSGSGDAGDIDNSSEL